MSGRMAIDTTRVAALARDLTAAADDLAAGAASARSLTTSSTPTSAPWVDAVARHDAGVAAVPAALGVLGDRARSVADALVAAVGTTVAQDSAAARSVRDAGAGLS
ncbi:hypothetical protein ACXVUM_14860 [Williamsia sp. SKLECPSW1]